MAYCCKHPVVSLCGYIGFALSISLGFVVGKIAVDAAKFAINSNKKMVAQ